MPRSTKNPTKISRKITASDIPLLGARLHHGPRGARSSHSA
jgi:hypothetical protein